MLSRKIGNKFLIALLIMLLVAPTAFAGEQVKLIFNGKEYQADVTLKDGVTYVQSAALNKIPGLEVGNDPIVPIRKLFESQGGVVSWDNDNNQVIVSWREKAGDLTADELVIKYSESLKEANTYKMKGSYQLEFGVEGVQDLIEIPNMPKMEATIEGIFQYEPMAMYIKQTMNMPLDELEELGLSPEELEAEGLDEEMVTEIVWLDNAIYQKNPGFDQWIVQDLAEVEGMPDINELMQITPQQSMEMMNKAGVINVFGEDVEKDGREYYTIKNYIDADSFKSLVEETMNNFDITAFIEAAGAQSDMDAQEAEDFNEMFEKVFETILNNINAVYYIDTLVDKETLLPDYMNFDLNMQIDLKPLIEIIAAMEEVDETEELSEILEMPISLELKMKGDYQLYDYGADLELPDLSDAISQEEYIQQLMELMEQAEQD
ncbi:conserved exported protein of unknown function [Tepidanaerobacter acetatoxydans Re1]|uniref:Copper amine oxidase-like N-terminal domain-containing protein n=1 Tax=Tepidanaerobacter acetatoxydans (strain DSM 21804 / JCM 16047 / Re1) TaxID=1209989 RepID=F4LT78_TEPAE|nr:DUF6612 family protein [Tepidanaerobacter acetatoxydans]AEE92478.1 hypothetical protein TepRe1_2366 [Tepidanaerobacter acetatoxydans Re1]CCP27405.1 conserved exported protein of unknown function [Tepidanaerobacter acetatoxydans Re1]